MPDDRTLITELGTALGTFPYSSPEQALAARPGALRISDETWGQLDRAVRSMQYSPELRVAFENGRALLQASDGLRHRRPILIEWTGGRRPPGDEVAPIDLRIDHVYQVSCKYDSDILANASPGRVFEGLLATSGSWERDNWYHAVAAVELDALYRACVTAVGLRDLPPTATSCSRDQLALLRRALGGRTYPDQPSRTAYAQLCRSVSTASAQRWSDRLESSGVDREIMLWRLLRIGSAPYFVLGMDRRTGGPARYRVAGPWDWREQFELEEFVVAAGVAGQPRVDWRCTCRSRADRQVHTIDGHVEIRWSHGRFAQPPEAKVYLDTPMSLLPGYYRLGGARDPQLSLFPDATEEQ